jgi:Transglycosylase SLT domain
LSDRMRATLRSFGTPVALVLGLVLAGSAGPGPQRPPAPSLASAAYVPDVGAGTEASVTAVDPSGSPVDLPAPAIRIAASGPALRHPVQVDIADVLLRAYAGAAAGSPVDCHLPVSLLAAIGQVESGSLVGRPIDAQHRTSVLGPVLDGHGFAAVPDTDHGRWDGNTRWDRAVGPMQFIPSTWARFGVDGDGDGTADPQDIEDAAATAAAYLCYGGRDLARPADVSSAVLAYNHSSAYLALVLTYAERYHGLGLDRPSGVTGLSTSFALHATPVAAVDGWSAALAARAEAPVRSTAKAQQHQPRKASAPAKSSGSAGRQSSGPAVPSTGGPTVSVPSPDPAQPGSDPGTGPGSVPGTEPGTVPGNQPGNQPSTGPATGGGSANPAAGDPSSCPSAVGADPSTAPDAASDPTGSVTADPCPPCVTPSPSEPTPSAAACPSGADPAAPSATPSAQADPSEQSQVQPTPSP